MLIILTGMGMFLTFQSGLMPFTRDGNISIDTSVWVQIAREMANGKMVYRDLFDHKGPLLFLLYSNAYRLNGITGIWLLQCVFLAADIVACLKCSVMMGKNRAVGLYCTMAVLLSLNAYCAYMDSSVEEMSLPFMLISLFVFLSYFHSEDRSIEKHRIVLLGICAGAVFFSLPNMTALWIVYSLAVIYEGLCLKRYKDILVQMTLFLCGFFLMSCLIIIWLWSNSSLSAWWEKGILFNFLYAGAADWSSRIKTFKFFLHYRVQMVSLLINIWLVFSVRKNRIVYLANLLYMILNQCFMSMSGRTYEIYAIALIPGYILPLTYGAQIIWNQFIQNRKWKCVIAILAASCSLLLLYGKGGYRGIERIYDNINVSEEEQQTLDVMSYIAEHTSVQEEISVIGNACYIYVGSERYSATEYLYTHPLCSMSKELGKDFYEQMMLQCPSMIVLPKDFNEHKPYYADEICSFLNKKYSKSYETERFEVYKVL